MTNGGASVFDEEHRTWFRLLGGETLAIFPACGARGGSLVGATDLIGGHAALVLFDDPREEGAVVWTRDFAPSREVLLATNRILTTPQMTVVEWSVPGERALLVGSANGSALERDSVLNDAVRGRFIEEMQADGNHLVLEIAGDIYLYTRGARGTASTVENLTRSPSMQFDPWVSGSHVVWIDQRHGPNGTAWQLDNTEVYLYDIPSRTERRITHDPPERPVIQVNARIEGNWIVWSDQRNSGYPNTWPVASNVQLHREVYGYHLPSGREVPLVTGRNLLGSIALQRGELWYNCSLLSPRVDGVYRMPMPTAP